MLTCPSVYVHVKITCTCAGLVQSPARTLVECVLRAAESSSKNSIKFREQSGQKRPTLISRGSLSDISTASAVRKSPDSHSGFRTGQRTMQHAHGVCYRTFGQSRRPARPHSHKSERRDLWSVSAVRSMAWRKDISRPSAFLFGVLTKSYLISLMIHAKFV